MAKKKTKGNKDKQTGRKPMTMVKLVEVRDWLDNMNRYLEKAIELSRRMDGGKLDESDDLFWALVKYAENVQECIIQLDSVNGTILPAFDEVPLEANAEAGFSWKGMKGMRQRLAHDFRKIDPEILWQTVTDDFPILFYLTSHVVLAEASAQDGRLQIKFRVKEFRTLPAFQEQEGFKSGNSMIALFFDGSHKAQCVRIARVDDRTVRFKSSDDITLTKMSVSLIDHDGTVEQLGDWPSSAMPGNS